MHIIERQRVKCMFCKVKIWRWPKTLKICKDCYRASISTMNKDTPLHEIIREVYGKSLVRVRSPLGAFQDSGIRQPAVQESSTDARYIIGTA